VLGILQLLLGWSSFYNTLLGFFALGLESMLPIPQLIQNHKRQSLAGFQMTVLAGWTFGDAFKVRVWALESRSLALSADALSSPSQSVYYLVKSAPMQFTIFGLFQLMVDLGICAQAYMYRDRTARETAEMKTQQQQLAGLRRAERGEGEEELESRGTIQRPRVAQNGSPAARSAPLHDTSPEGAPFAMGDIEADEEDDSSALKGGNR
jgi:solute carrier family 66, member 2